MIAILSDVHANLEALDAVLADIADRPVGAVYCLGDTLGYGPDPLPCLDRVMRMELVLLGNHDHAVLHEPDGFPASAERVVLFHRAQMEAVTDTAGQNRYRVFLLGIPQSYVEGDALFVHGSPRNPLNEFLFPEDIYNSRKMTRIGERMERLCFCGHTHVPGAFVESKPGEWAYHSPNDCGDKWRPDGRKTIINVGSVGQPRDGDPRAGYVTWDGEYVRFVRIPYDVATTIAKVRRLPDIADFQGERLAEGR